MRRKPLPGSGGGKRRATKTRVAEELEVSAAYRVSRSRLEWFAAALEEGGVSWAEVPVWECPIPYGGPNSYPSMSHTGS